MSDSKKIQILLSDELKKNGAVAVALERLSKIGPKCRFSFHVDQYEKVALVPNSIVVTVSREEIAECLNVLKNQKVKQYTLPGENDGFGIWSLQGKSCLIYSPSPRGAAYALFHIADRMNVTGKLPKDSLVLDPAFEDRVILCVDLPDADIQTPPYVSSEKLAAGRERAKGKIREALCFGATHILFSPTYRLIHWDDEIEGQRNEKYRDIFREFIQQAHNLGLKVLTIGDEFIYTESLLKKFNAEISLENKGFWKALQHKYRALLTDFPELDGVAVRIGEMIPCGGLRAFDVIHNDSSLSLEEKYYLFVKSVYDVVVGEFGKLYYHRTWVTNDWEQHSVADIYKRIFNRLPVENLFVSIKLTKTDQWDYQAFNPTIGLSSHRTIVELEMAKGEHSSQRFPDFMGIYQSAGLQYAKNRGASGVAVHEQFQNTFRREDSFYHDQFQNTFWREASFYAASKLMWNPDHDIEALARDWATLKFGRRAARYIAEILMLSYDALMKSLYLKPYASTHAWNPLPHIKTDRYSLEGDPVWDAGRGHLNFLYELYLQCKPWLEETIEEMDEGKKIYDGMLKIFIKAKSFMEDSLSAKYALETLQLGQAFINLSVLYSKAFLRFFEYRDRQTKQNRLRTKQLITDLKNALSTYRKRGGTFDTIAIEQFMTNALEFLANPKEAEEKLRNAPDEMQVIEIMKNAQESDETELRTHPDAVKVFRWQGNVDGKDMLIVRGREIKLVHLCHGQPTEVDYAFFSEIPRDSKLVIHRIEARGYVCVVEQPTERNGWSAKIYISDPQDGRDIYRFEAYAVNARNN